MKGIKQIIREREKYGWKSAKQNAFVIKTFPIKDHGILCWGREFHYAKIEKAGRFNRS